MSNQDFYGMVAEWLFCFVHIHAHVYVCVCVCVGVWVYICEFLPKGGVYFVMAGYSILAYLNMH